MNIIHLLIAIFIISFIVTFFYSNGNKIEKTLWALLCSLLIWASSILLILLISFCLMCFEVGVTERNESYSFPIYSLGDSQKIHGRFGLGTGEVNSIDMYHFYRKTQDGLFYRGNVPIHKTFIKEGDYKPKVIVNYTLKFGKLIKFLYLSESQPIDDSYEYVIEVPTGTVIQKFEVK